MDELSEKILKILINQQNDLESIIFYLLCFVFVTKFNKKKEVFFEGNYLIREAEQIRQ